MVSGSLSGDFFCATFFKFFLAGMMRYLIF
jgi:hypothetical protein